MKKLIQSGKMNKKLKQKIASWFRITQADLEEEFPDLMAKKFGDTKGVSFELDSLVKTFCTVNNWASGEGFDISWETEENTTIHLWASKSLSLHHTEVECMLACLNNLKYFENNDN